MDDEMTEAEIRHMRRLLKRYGHRHEASPNLNFRSAVNYVIRVSSAELQAINYSSPPSAIIEEP